ncbi:hypothetical protein A2229_03815 [Candidatus Peregrinibacteria bacterium RIFOXYA2_FULL_33_7]|nr:MAG: hypothetical protein A2229_03815 [Candidatus Peregrinibacteria bacterium RIFOXYA2_FULL_33_7]
MSHTISHSALFGISLALFLNYNINIFLFLAAFIGILMIFALKNFRLMASDSSLEIIAQTFIAASIIIISQIKGYKPDIMQFLFGDILAVNQQDVLLSVIISILTFIFFILFKDKLLQITFNEELAKSSGAKVSKINFIFFLCLGLTIAISLKIIGAILISAFLIIPANTAKILAKNFRQMYVYALIFAILGTTIGLFASYHLDTPSGAMIVITLSLILTIASIIKKAAN